MTDINHQLHHLVFNNRIQHTFQFIEQLSTHFQVVIRDSTSVDNNLTRLTKFAKMFLRPIPRFTHPMTDQPPVTSPSIQQQDTT